MDDVLAETCNAISPSKRTVIGQIFLQVEGPVVGGPLPEGREALLVSGVASSAEPLVTLPPGGRGNTPASSEPPSPEALGGLAAEVTATSPEGEVSPLSGGTGSPSSEPSFRPVLPVRPSLRSPSLRPVVDPAPLSPPPVPSPAPVSARPPLPAFIQALLDEERAMAKAAAEAAARAAAQVRESPVPAPRTESMWAPLPPRKDTPAPVPVVPVATIPAPPPVPVPRPRIEVGPTSAMASLGAVGPAPVYPPAQRRMSREEVSANLRIVGEKARQRIEARERERVRQAFR